LFIDNNSQKATSFRLHHLDHWLPILNVWNVTMHARSLSPLRPVRVKVCGDVVYVVMCDCGRHGRSLCHPLNTTARTSRRYTSSTFGAPAMRASSGGHRSSSRDITKGGTISICRIVQWTTVGPRCNTSGELN